MENCIFCQIVQGKIPAAKVFEDENFLAFLTISPHQPGHTLIIPKKHIPYIFDMEDTELKDIIVFCKPIAKAIKNVFRPKTGKVGVMVAGMGVPHVHIHLIPMESEADLNFENAKHNIPFEEIEANAEKIKEELSSDQIKL